MHSKTIAALALGAVLLIASGCDSTTDTLFGRSVPVDAGDITEPSVKILIADPYVKQPASGVLTTETGRRFARVEPFINIAVVGHDPEGVRFIELDDIIIQPFCSTRAPEDGDAASPDQAAAPVTRPGERIALPGSSQTATTRLTLVEPLHIADGVNQPSPHCPEAHPVLVNAVTRLKARAGNFAGQTRDSGTAVLSLKPISRSKGLAPRSGETGERSGGGGS
jgi:hypothetical protein